MKLGGMEDKISLADPLLADLQESEVKIAKEPL